MHIRAHKYVKQILMDIKGEIDNNTGIVIVMDFLFVSVINNTKE